MHWTSSSPRLAMLLWLGVSGVLVNTSDICGAGLFRRASRVPVCALRPPSYQSSYPLSCPQVVTPAVASPKRIVIGPIASERATDDHVIDAPTVDALADDEIAGPYKPINGVITLPVRPSHLAFDKDRIYVASWRDRRILVIDANRGKLLHTFTGLDTFVAKDENGQPEQRLCCPGPMVLVDGKLFVSQSFGTRLVILDADSMQIVRHLEVGKGGGEFAVSPDKNTVYYASNEDRSFTRIDAHTLTAERVAYPKGGRGIGSLAVSPDGQRLYLGLQRGTREVGAEPPAKAAGPVNPLDQTYPGSVLVIYDLKQKRYIASKSIGDTLKARGDDSSSSRAMAFSEDGKKLYLAMVQCMAGVHVYDTQKDELTQPLTFESKSEYFDWPSCGDVTETHGKLFVTISSNNELAILNAKTHTPFETIGFGEDLVNWNANFFQNGDQLYVPIESDKQIRVFDLKKLLRE